MAGDTLFQTLQKAVTMVHRLDALSGDFLRFQERVYGRLDRLETESASVRERVARLEACRDADHAQAEAEMARFRAEVERAELRLSGLLTDARGRRQLPRDGGS